MIMWRVILLILWLIGSAEGAVFTDTHSYGIPPHNAGAYLQNIWEQEASEEYGRALDALWEQEQEDREREEHFLNSIPPPSSAKDQIEEAVFHIIFVIAMISMIIKSLKWWNSDSKWR
jgi:hypothetical protein